MILAIAILSTVSSVGYLGLIQFNKSKDLGIATADFLNTLNEAKTDTQTQINGASCKTLNAGWSFGGYQVSLASKSFSLELVCKDQAGAIQVPGAPTNPIKTKPIPSSVSIVLNKVTQKNPVVDQCNNTQLDTATSVLFNAPGGSLDASYAANINNTKGVGIDVNGTILQCDASCNVSLPCPPSPTPSPLP